MMKTPHLPASPEAATRRHFSSLIALGLTAAVASGLFAAKQSAGEDTSPNRMSGTPAERVSYSPGTTGTLSEEAIPGRDSKYQMAVRMIKNSHGTIQLSPAEVVEHMHTEANPNAPNVIDPKDDVLQDREIGVAQDLPLSTPTPETK